MKLVWISAALMLMPPPAADAKDTSDCALLQRLAQEHSNDMAVRESMDHDGFYSRAARGARAENVAMGSKTKEATMAQWRASPGHAANLKLPGCKAVAYAVSKAGRYYWTMEIGKSPIELIRHSSSGHFGSSTSAGGSPPGAAHVRSAAQQVVSGISEGIGKLKRLFRTP